jgi:rhamnopyranosyl-N-acetylglucosaminyl-diphospho-decaprenol beta-1,3/1,4-galactofuranosyltransferase
MTSLRVAAVIVTFKRSAALAETLRAARKQTRPPDCFYVVDNGGDESTAELLRNEFPEMLHLRTRSNLGTGGRSYGIEAARAAGFDAYWLVDDDSPPVPDALEALLAGANRRSGQVGMVGGQGGVVRFGLIRHIDDPRRLARGRLNANLFAVDFVLLDGSLVLGHTVEAVGLPRVDYFIMMEDVEYPLRARRAGLEVVLLARDTVRRRFLGSTPGTSLWRAYYQSRNHVRMALDLRSPSLLLGCLIRQVYFLIAALAAPDRRWERFKLRWRGISDGLHGRMGRRLEPDVASL